MKVEVALYVVFGGLLAVLVVCAIFWFIDARPPACERGAHPVIVLARCADVQR